MSAIAFDPLEYMHQLEASGVPREQAEVHAKGMTAMFLHNREALVTKDYLDSRFKESEAGIEVKIDELFGGMQSKIDHRFADIDLCLERMNGRFSLLYWMQGFLLSPVF